MKQITKWDRLKAKFDPQTAAYVHGRELVRVLDQDNPDVNKALELIEKGALLELTNGLGETPLMLAIQRGLNDFARVLIQKNVDINRQGFVNDFTGGWDVGPAVFIAVGHGQMEGLKLLLEAGARLDILNDEKTIVDFAKDCRRYEMVDMLEAYIKEKSIALPVRKAPFSGGAPIQREY